ncbi:MAG: hypothetical protein ACE5EY_04785 [Anaerolineae bacterium]
MQIPERIPGFRWLFVLMGVYTAVWISFEGHLTRALIMGVGWTAVLLMWGWQRRWGGQTFSRWQWWGRTAVTGLLLGLGSGLLTLAFMIIKTGLHAHGPEFTAVQINWVIRQTPIWTAAGFLAGLGLGLVTMDEG